MLHTLLLLSDTRFTNTYLTNFISRCCILICFYIFICFQGYKNSVNARRARLHCLSDFMFCQISYRILFLLVSIGTSDQKDFSGIRGTLFLPIWMECLPTLRRIFFCCFAPEIRLIFFFVSSLVIFAIA